MVKGAYVFIGSLLISMTSFGAATSLDCQSRSSFEANLNELAKVTDKVDPKSCPQPSKDQINEVCIAIKDSEKNTNKNIQGPKYHEYLWNLACVKPKDSPDEAKMKIFKMWDAYKTKFNCTGFTGVSVSDGNILKFSIDVGFPTIVETLMERYNFDINFVDPTDSKTILDFVHDRIKESKNGSEELADFQELYKDLKDKGAIHTNNYKTENQIK